MSDDNRAAVGSIGWFDLTVPDADRIRDFYSSVVGWKPEPVAMGDYSDYNMTAPDTGQPRAGVCHKRGTNAQLPPAWMIYIFVADLDASVAKVEELGGKVLVQPKSSGGQARYCIIEDPAGAVCALYEPG